MKQIEQNLHRYEEAVLKLKTDQENGKLQDAALSGVPNFAGAAVEGVPIVGPMLREGVKATAQYLLARYYTNPVRGEAELLRDPVADLTKAFVEELNRLVDTSMVTGSRQAKRRRVILFFDTFEQLEDEAAPWLLDYFLPANISSNIVLVVAGRTPIEHSTSDPKRWLPYFDSETIYSISLNSFTQDETSDYLEERGITDPERIKTIWQLSRGLPLYLGLLTSNPRSEVDPTKDVVVNFLRWIPEQEQMKRRLTLDAALFSRPFTQDDLEAFTNVPEQERPALYDWLTGLPFVRPQEGRYRYHEVVQELFSRHLFQRSKKAYYATRRALADYYQQVLEEIQQEGDQERADTFEWLELVLALAYQLLLLPDEASHNKAIEKILNAYSEHTNQEQDTAIARVLRNLSQEPSPHSISPAAREVAIQLFRYVEADFRSQESPAAAGALVEKVAHAPSFPSELLAGIYTRRGDAYNYLGEKELALESFQQALKLLEPTKYSERGWVYLNAGNYQEALACQNQALEQNPQHASAYYSRGFAYAHLGEYQLGIADFNHALELDPNYTEAYNGRGWAYYYAGEYQKASESFEHLLELDPDHLATLRGLGLTYKELKEYQQALAMFDRNLELDTGNPFIYTDRSLCYIYLKEYKRSIEDCNRALGLAPKFAPAYFQRGYTYLWLKIIEQAQADFTRSWELDSTNEYYGWIYEWTNMCQQKPDLETSERLRTIAAANPQWYSAHVCRGVVYWVQEHYEEALTELEQAISLAQGRGEDAHFWKGIVYASLGRDGEAIAAIEQALALEMPPILLAPLRWFEQDRPDFYEHFVAPLLAHYG